MPLIRLDPAHNREHISGFTFEQLHEILSVVGEHTSDIILSIMLRRLACERYYSVVAHHIIGCADIN